MNANASHVSRVLNAAGIIKASPYKPFGRDVEGYGVRRHTPHTPTTVYVTIDGDKGQALLDKCASALTAAGFVVSPAGRRTGIHLGHLHVTKPEPAVVNDDDADRFLRDHFVVIPVTMPTKRGER